MPNLVEIADFTGSASIPVDNFSAVKYEAIRDERQFDLIYQIMGAELGALFIADLDGSGVPEDQRFEDLYNAFVDQDYDNTIVRSEGIKEMVKQYLYFYFAREGQFVLTISGNNVSKGENSETSVSNLFFVRLYNRAVATAKAIQWFIGENSADYPEYKGTEIEYLSIY